MEKPRILNRVWRFVWPILAAIAAGVAVAGASFLIWGEPTGFTTRAYSDRLSWTGIGLIVETTMGRIFILLPALIAHGKHFHRRLGAIIGEGFQNAEPGAAVGAVGKWIAVPAICRVENLADTLWAGGDVGEDNRRFLPGRIAAAYREPGGSPGLENETVAVAY